MCLLRMSKLPRSVSSCTEDVRCRWEGKISSKNCDILPVCIIKSRKRLNKHTLPVQEAVDQLIAALPELKRHIFTAHMQWHAHDTARRNLDQYSVITVEDYQQNMEIVYGEMPTSTAYSGNKLTVAMYPLVFEYLDDNGNLGKAAYGFMLDDKKHDHQQVRAFEKKAFELFRQDTDKTIMHWYQFTDGCGAQLRSQFVNGDMTTAKEDLGLTHLDFHYFEAHEGKNVSVAVGSIAKCAYMRAVSRGEVEGISSAKEAVNIINKNLEGQIP